MLKKQQRKVFIDSNVFFYSIIGDSKYGKACSKILLDVSERKIEAFISPLILLEVANSLRKFRVSSIRDRIRAIISLPIHVVDLNRLDIYEGVELAERYNLSPYDATHVVVASRIGVQYILSADKDFDKVAEVNRIDPLVYNKM